MLSNMLACSHVSKQSGDTTILHDVSFAIAPKDCACIVGPSGAGKSTLLNLLVRAEDPTSGAVTVDNVDVRTLPGPVLQLFRRRLGIISQEPMLMSWATVAENLAYPLEIREMTDVAIAKAVKQMLATLELSNKSHLLPADLSPGELRLVAMGRALIAKPLIVLADEPLAQLDTDQRVIALQILQDAREAGSSLLIFSQDASLAAHFGARILRLDGKMKEESAPAQLKKKPAEEPMTEVAPEHHILEEEGAVQVAIRAKNKVIKKDLSDEVLVNKEAAPPEKGKRKIRITAINS